MRTLLSGGDGKEDDAAAITPQASRPLPTGKTDAPGLRHADVAALHPHEPKSGARWGAHQEGHWSARWGVAGVPAGMPAGVPLGGGRWGARRGTPLGQCPLKCAH